MITRTNHAARRAKSSSRATKSNVCKYSSTKSAKSPILGLVVHLLQKQ